MIEHKPTGRHLLLDVRGCTSATLDDQFALLDILCAVVEAVGATVLSAETRHFDPQGVTVLLMLAESHAALHTYPEHGVYMAEVFTCGDVDPEPAAAALLAALPGADHTKTLIVRG